MARGWLQDKLLSMLKKQEKFTEGGIFDTYERQRPVEGKRPSWNHLFVLGNVDYSTFIAFKLRLNELIRDAEVVTENNIHSIGSRVFKPANSSLSFTKTDSNRSDLCHLWKAADFHRGPKDFIQQRMIEGLPLEFCYRTEQEGPVSIRQGIPLKAAENYFQAKSHLGIRNYSYEKVQWVSTQESITENFLEAPYAVLVTMDNSNFNDEGSRLRLVYGVLVNGGLELNIPAERHPEDKDASLLYSFRND